MELRAVIAEFVPAPLGGFVIAVAGRPRAICFGALETGTVIAAPTAARAIVRRLACALRRAASLPAHRT